MILSRFSGLRLAVLLCCSSWPPERLGYTLIEGWTAWDAFYMTVTTVTTVGLPRGPPVVAGAGRSSRSR